MLTLDRYTFGFCKQSDDLTVHEWAIKNVELSPRITEQPGPYSTSLHPYAKEILECVSDPYVKRVSLCWGSQTSKTTTFYVMLGFVIDQDPRAILWVFPNLALCKAFSSDRWMPFCRESKALVKHLPRYVDGSIDSDRFSLTKQEFTRCTMNLVGAGSSANVRSYPVSVLVLDDSDVIEERTRRECMDRVKAMHIYKVLQSSTPVTEHGGIWQEFHEGERRRYMMPCPHCGQPMLFRLKNDDGDLILTWNKKAELGGQDYDLGLVQKTTSYICEKCGEKISDTYTLNGGHVYFFYDKGKYLAERYQALITEMKGRGFNPDSNRLFPVDIFKDNGLYNDWTPSPHEYKIIRERLDLRISQKPDWYRKTTSSSDL